MFAQLILLAVSSVYCHPLRFVSQEAAEAYYKAQHENKDEDTIKSHNMPKGTLPAACYQNLTTLFPKRSREWIREYREKLCSPEKDDLEVKRIRLPPTTNVNPKNPPYKGSPLQ
jgi:hypothetical protein